MPFYLTIVKEITNDIRKTGIATSYKSYAALIYYKRILYVYKFGEVMKLMMFDND